jgi:transglutaminase-like putative cysteine protease
MNRRQFLHSTAIAYAAAIAPRAVAAQVPSSTHWRTFEVTTRVELLEPVGPTRIWLPAALLGATPYQRTQANTFTAPGGTAKLLETRTDALGIVAAAFPAGATPRLTLTSRVATRAHSVDFSIARNRVTTDAATLAHFLRPTTLLPTDGIVRIFATDITRGAKTDIDKARAIYEWIVDNTFRDPATRGCGLGDIRFMLESRSLGGKCADLNALYVGLARAAGLPARDVYGIRVAKSDLGYASLGASSATVTKSQHCRAEVYLTGFGWVPVDPADVRKVVLEEPPGNRAVDDPMVRRARARLFGSWEMKWIAFNYAHDIVLPGSKGASIPFFMYPQAETATGRVDSLDPEQFKYEIASREV